MAERLGIPLRLFKGQFTCLAAENKDIPEDLWLKL
jgi:hypothetical protein